MARRLLSFLAIFAFLVSPVHMIGGAAMAMPHHQPAMPDHQPAMAAGHCDPSPASEPGEGGKDAAIDCLIACAGLPALPPAAPAGFVEMRASPAPAPLGSLHGLSAEAATPPPRFS